MWSGLHLMPSDQTLVLDQESFGLTWHWTSNSTKIQWRNSPRGTRSAMSISIFMTLCSEVHEKMFRSGETAPELCAYADDASSIEMPEMVFGASTLDNRKKQSHIVRRITLPGQSHR
ncbi:hypothetical protein TNCV_4220691 [Trichonephila clavipes]|nr:hypothetical protein TNCV_4220691 [Trichonephila clavipes]